MKKFATITWIALILFLAVIVPAFSQGLDEKAAKADQEAIIVGQTPPDFTLVDREGNEFTLSEMTGEKPVIVDFWATWCGPCRMSMPGLVEFNEMYGDKVNVVGVGIWMEPTDEQDDNTRTVSEADLDAFEEEFGINFPLLINWESDVAEKYFVHGIPYTIVIGADGNIAALYYGYHENLESDLVSLLELE